MRFLVVHLLRESFEFSHSFPPIHKEITWKIWFQCATVSTWITIPWLALSTVYFILIRAFFPHNNYSLSSLECQKENDESGVKRSGALVFMQKKKISSAWSDSCRIVTEISANWADYKALDHVLISKKSSWMTKYFFFSRSSSRRRVAPNHANLGYGFQHRCSYNFNWVPEAVSRDLWVKRTFTSLHISSIIL